MQDYYPECAEWLADYLASHVVLRTSSNGRATRVLLLARTQKLRLVCFQYQSEMFPIAEPFDTVPIPGKTIKEQINSLMRMWDSKRLTFWTAHEQAVACELGLTHIAAANAYSIELLFKYHRLLACLEANPRLEGCSIEDVARAHMRLKSLLEQRTTMIKKSWETLKALNID